MKWILVAAVITPFIALAVRHIRRPERDDEYLNLLDRFCILHRLRLDAIKRAEQNGDDDILKSEDLRFLKEDTVRCLDELLARNPRSFFRNVRRELVTELTGE